MLLYMSVRQSSGGGVGAFEDFLVYFLGAFVVELLVFGYGLFKLGVAIVSREFLGFVFSIFCDCG